MHTLQSLGLNWQEEVNTTMCPLLPTLAVSNLLFLTHDFNSYEENGSGYSQNHPLVFLGICEWALKLYVLGINWEAAFKISLETSVTILLSGASSDLVPSRTFLFPVLRSDCDCLLLYKQPYPYNESLGVPNLGHRNSWAPEATVPMAIKVALENISVRSVC